MERYTATTAIATAIIGRKFSKYRVAYINPEQTCPACDIGNKVLYIPQFAPIINHKDDEIVRGFTAHECAHARYTPEERFGDFQKMDSLTRNLVNAMEDERIERGVHQTVPVLGEALDALNASAVERLSRMFTAEPPQSPVDEAIMALHAKSGGHVIGWHLSDTAKTLVESAEADYAKSRALKADSLKDYDKLVGIASEIVAKWRKLFPPQQNGGQGNGQDQQDGHGDEQSQQNGGQSSQDQQSQQNGQQSGKQSSQQDQQNGQGGQQSQQDRQGGQDGEQSQDQQSQQDGQDGQDQQGGQGDEQSQQDGKQSSQDERDGKGKPAEQTSDTLKTSGRNYLREAIDEELKRIKSEQSQQFGDYMPYDQEDVERVMQPCPSEYEWVEETANRLMGRIASELQDALLSTCRCRRRHYQEDGWLDDRALVELCKSLSENVFANKVKGASLKSTAVTLLIDESGSMTGTRLRNAIALANAFAEAMDYVGVKFEIIGHSFDDLRGGWKRYEQLRQLGYNRIGVLENRIYKSFDEDFEQVKTRLGSSFGARHACTADPDAVLYACTRNLASDADRHIVLVLCDGQPEYGSSVGNPREFLKQVIKTFTSLGVELKALGIQTDAPERYYGKENTVVVQDLSTIGDEFFQLVREMLVQAE